MNAGRNSKQTTFLCRDTGEKGMLPAQHTTFNTLDDWGHKQKGKGLERKGYRFMARNVYNTLGYMVINESIVYVLYCSIELVIILTVYMF